MGRRRHRLDRVDDEVLENLEDLRAVDLDGLGIVGDLESDLRDGTGGRDFDRIEEDFFGGTDRLGANAALGEGEELFRETFGGVAGFLGVGEDGAIALGGAGNRDGAEDRGEEVVEIVRDAAGEEAEGLEAVGFHQLIGRERHLFGVAENDDDTAGFAVRPMKKTELLLEYSSKNKPLLLRLKSLESSCSSGLN